MLSEYVLIQTEVGKVAHVAQARMSRAPWNLGGGPDDSQAACTS
jgi:hypothetical protein